MILRPIFIYKYEKDKEARARDFFEYFQQEGLEKAFRQVSKEEQLDKHS